MVIRAHAEIEQFIAMATQSVFVEGTMPAELRYLGFTRQLSLATSLGLVPSEAKEFDSLSLVDTTPLPCAQSIATVNRSQLAPWRGFGYSAAHSRFYWGMRLVLWCGPDGCVRDFDLVPANAGEREAVLELLERHPPPASS